MDKVKQVGQFVWKFRFWFGMGLSIILASMLYFSGATTLLREAQAKQNQLESVYKAADAFRNKSDAPNPRWEEAASKIEGELAKTVDGVWVKLYRQQEKLFTWPEEVSKQFGNRPFAADLSDNRNRYLVNYRFAYPAQIEELWEIANPIRRNDEGKVVGVVEFRKEQLAKANWNGPVKSIEAWLAQEQLWVNRAILLAIAKANKGKDGWKTALIRRINDIRIGDSALDSKTRSSTPTLVGVENAAEEKHKNLATSKQENTGFLPIRYLQKTDQFREIPVFISLMIDQTKATPVLTCLADADLGFVIHQWSLFAPTDKMEMPFELRQDAKVGKSSERDDPIYNTMQLDVWGRVRLYEMPPSMKEEYKKKVEAADKKPDPAADAAKVEPPVDNAPKPADAKAEPPKATDAKPADAKPAESKPAAGPKAAETPKADAAPKAGAPKAPTEEKKAEEKKSDAAKKN